MVFVDIPDEFASALTNANIYAAGAARELVVAFAGDFRDPKLLRFLSEPRPVLFIGLLNGCPILGPLQRLGQSVCIGCTQYWARASTQAPDPEVQPDPTSGLHLLAGLTRDVISEFNRRGTISGLDRSLQSIHGRTLDRRRHSIVSLRSCRFCRREEEIHVKEHCSPLTGIVNRLRRTSQPVAGVYHSYSSFIVPPGSEAVLSTASRTSWGRGLTAAGAENSCIGEAIEGYSLMHRGDEATVRARLSEIDGIDPRKILLISQRQYSAVNAPIIHRQGTTSLVQSILTNQSIGFPGRTSPMDAERGFQRRAVSCPIVFGKVSRSSLGRMLVDVPAAVRRRRRFYRLCTRASKGTRWQSGGTTGPSARK